MSSYSSADDEYESDEPPELELNLDRLKEIATEALRVPCTNIKRLTRGSRHEILVLDFEQGNAPRFESLIRSKYSCIARFARIKGNTLKEESEIATIRHVKENTSIPVPEIYYQDFNPDNAVGAAFVLMERLPGRHLYKTWDDLSLVHKKVVLCEIASVVSQFASLSFDQIGCITNNGIGPTISPCYGSPHGPFTSTLDYLQSFVPVDSTQSPELVPLFGQIRTELANFIQKDDTHYLEPPFSMIHADFDAQNMLFVASPDGSGPKLTGLIDFEFAHTGPVYFLYEYPLFTQDVYWSKHLYAENAILRAHFVSQIFKHLPNETAQQLFIVCINSKSFILNSFQESFMSMESSTNTLAQAAKYFLQTLKDGNGLPYSGRIDYKPEYYFENGEPVVAGKEQASEELHN